MVREAALVAQRCMEAQESGIVNLSECGLMAVPDALFLFLKNCEVKSVNLSGNQLTKIPSKLAKAFPHVEELNISFNSGINTLPKEFSSCEKLSILNASGNKFAELSTIAFKSLKSLNLSKNNLENVTDTDLDVICHIEEVDLTQNQLSDESKAKLSSISNIKL